MLIKDWFWSCAFVLAVLLEAAAAAKLCARLFKHRNITLSPPLSFGMGFALILQLHFALALFAIKNGAAHWTLVGVALVLLLVLRKRGSLETDPAQTSLHLRYARLLSPHLWRRAWMWAPFPLLWLLLRFLDALMPHKNLPMAAKHWAAAMPDLTAFSPEQLYGSLWESLSFHFFCLSRAFQNQSGLEVLSRVHFSTQLTHLFLGQCLTIATCAWILAQLVEKSWASLLHSGSAQESRNISHAMGMPRLIMVPAALFFGWLVCAEGALADSGVQAQNLWGSALFFTLAFCALHSSTTSSLAAFLAGLFASVGFVIQPQHFAFFLATALLALVLFPRHIHKFAFGAACGVAFWIYRNFSVAGKISYPPFLEPDALPGWIPLNVLLEHRLEPFAFSPVFAALFAFSLCGLVLLLFKIKATKSQNIANLKLLFSAAALAVASALGSKALGLHSRLVPTVVFAGVAVIAASLIALGSAPKGWLASVARGVPFAWLFIGFLSVPIPLHLFWQTLGVSASTAAELLAKNQPDFRLQEWTLTHVPAPESVAWSLDSQPYYAAENTIAQTRSTLLTRMLLKAVTPNERIQALCELGFRYWAAPEHNSRPELSGLSAWLKLKDKPAFRTNEALVYALRCE